MSRDRSIKTFSPVSLALKYSSKQPLSVTMHISLMTETFFPLHVASPSTLLPIFLHAPHASVMFSESVDLKSFWWSNPFYILVISFTHALEEISQGNLAATTPHITHCFISRLSYKAFWLNRMVQECASSFFCIIFCIRYISYNLFFV